MVESQPPPCVPPGLVEGAEGESAGALHKSKVDYSQLSFVQKRLRKLSITSLCFGALTQKRWERAGGSLFLTTQVNSVQHAFRDVGVGELEGALAYPMFWRSFNPISTGAQCVELKLRWQFCVHTSTFPEINLLLIKFLDNF